AQTTPSPHNRDADENDVAPSNFRRRTTPPNDPSTPSPAPNHPAKTPHRSPSHHAQNSPDAAAAYPETTRRPSSNTGRYPCTRQRAFARFAKTPAPAAIPDNRPAPAHASDFSSPHSAFPRRLAAHPTRSHQTPRPELRSASPT